jgi:hypothetical protein
VRIRIQSLEKMQMKAKFFTSKIQYGYQKTQNFKSVKKFLKIHKKGISKNGTEICTFSTFTHVRQTCFAK